MLPENWEAVQIFLRCSTQWRYAGFTGVATGLDYPSIEAVMRMSGIKDQVQVFAKLQLIEEEALKAMQEQRDKQ